MSTPAAAGTLDANKAVVQSFFDQAVNKHDVTAIADLFAPDSQGTLDAAGSTGLEAVAQPSAAAAAAMPSLSAQAIHTMTEQALEAFPNIQIQIDLMVAEGDTVVVRWTETSNHFTGVSDAGHHVPMSSIDFFTVQNGKITSLVSRPDLTSALQALDALPDALASRLASPNAPEELFNSVQ
ncbi:ester cyclase [Nocardia sp. NBC_01327]|uniref:ester cyclase n=1 Tax=Nocardia sp. NBC_01327 TaxID=2903593 RepID=UPI002E14C9BF|nr:ester cyclase [Nocardia sp. NBC_01327]